jgi:SOS-response transcriptional repressor LexA
MKRNPTDKQQAILTAITLFLRQHGYSPSLRELCDMAALHLERLQEAGLIAYEPGKPRTIRLVRP